MLRVLETDSERAKMLSESEKGRQTGYRRRMRKGKRQNGT